MFSMHKTIFPMMLSAVFPYSETTKNTINQKSRPTYDTKRQRQIHKHIGKNQQKEHTKINDDHENSPKKPKICFVL